MFGKTGFMLVCLMGFTHATVRTGGLFNVVPLVASDGMGLSAGQIGSGFALGSLFGLAATYPAGMVADRFGRKPLIVYVRLLVCHRLSEFPGGLRGLGDCLGSDRGGTFRLRCR